MSELTVGSIGGLAANGYVVDVAAGSQITQPGMVLQVVNSTIESIFSTTSSTPVGVTGLEATITPSSSTSKILVLLNFRFGGDGVSSYRGQLDRSGTAISLGNSAGNNLGNVWLAHNSSGTGFGDYGLSILDTPNTTSSLTYQLQVWTSGSTIYVNGRNDGSAVSAARSGITLMEIAG